jgi:hypothetical protein
MLTPATMDNDELDAAMRRLSHERDGASGPRKVVIGRVLDACLDEYNARRTTEESCTRS